MNLSLSRRFALVFALGALSLASTGIARADGVTGTDPVPKGCGCHPTQMPAAPSDSTSVMQTMLVLLGLA